MSWEPAQLSNETLSLLSVDGLGAITLQKLVDATGGIHSAGNALLQREIDDVLPIGAGNLLRKRMSYIDPNVIRISTEAANAKIVTSVDYDFPQLLRPLPACPATLWYRGDIQRATSVGVGIVGSRRCTEYGKQIATIFSSQISNQDMTIYSGGARGIDGIAHRAAIRAGGTNVVILGSGLRMLYPPEHTSLFEQVIDEGGVLISEFPCDCPPKPANFPRRNRIVAGLSSAVLVIEAARRSGALITARIAVEEHGRDVFVIPGRIGDSASAGCLRVLDEGWVTLALEPGVVIEEAKSAYKRLLMNNFEELQ